MPTPPTPFGFATTLAVYTNTPAAVTGVYAGISGTTSLLGETWYSESEHLEGPWRRAKKIVTHDHYSFYNPKHHVQFDEAGGRFVYFEGTYTQLFSGRKPAEFTPRYEYNQILYRLDLDAVGQLK